MPCPLCGDICRCSSTLDSTVAPRWLAATNEASGGPISPVTGETQGMCEPSRQSGAEPVLPEAGGGPVTEDSTAWRQELAARLNRYHSRRKPRPPRYPSLRLRFEEVDASGPAGSVPSRFSALPQISNQALALDELAASVPARISQPQSSPAAQAPESAAAPLQTNQPPHDAAPHPALSAAPVTATVMPGVTAKIIEFPRSWTPVTPSPDELAEPVMERPRILEAPEVVPPPPALGGITIEPAHRPEMEKRPGIDIPLQAAPLARRVLSAGIDDVIIAAACALFGFIFWKLTAIRPPRLQMIGFLAGLAGLLWATYQYAFVVYSGTTPGLRLARLELTRFDGSPASRRLRRWRVLASFLSAVSLGMGYGWVFLDEDSLCWHDRITHTYVAPKSPDNRMGTDQFPSRRPEVW